MKSRSCCCKQRPCTCGHGKGNGNKTPPPGWRPQPLGTWLLIRYDAADTGARPVPSGDVWWTSPDIWVTGGDAYGNPIGGKPAVVHARIWNLGGLDACPAIVGFSFIEPGLGLPPTAPVSIGTVGALVPAANYAEVSIPWIPPKVEGNVHTCLIVTCSCAVTNDAPSVPGSVVADRHTGQRNMTIVGSPVHSFEFRLTMTNLRPWAASVQLGARALWSSARDLIAMGVADVPSLRTAVRAMDRPHTQPEYRMLARRAVMVGQHPAEHFSLLPAKQVPELVHVQAIDRRDVYPAGAVVPLRNRLNATDASVIEIGRAAELKPLQRASVHLAVTIPRHENSREWLIVHIAQITEGAIEGGYTMVLRAGSENRATDSPKASRRAVQTNKST